MCETGSDRSTGKPHRVIAPNFFFFSHWNRDSPLPNSASRSSFPYAVQSTSRHRRPKAPVSRPTFPPFPLFSPSPALRPETEDLLLARALTTGDKIFEIDDPIPRPVTPGRPFRSFRHPLSPQNCCGYSHSHSTEGKKMVKIVNSELG